MICLLIQIPWRQEWGEAVEAAKDRAENQQGVTFLYPEVKPFQDICTPMHQELITDYPELAPIYEGIQQWNAVYAQQ